MSILSALAALFVILLPLSSVFVALHKGNDVETALQVRPWSITFSLNAKNANRKAAPKNPKAASKP
jgi:hypothetical protein